MKKNFLAAALAACLLCASCAVAEARGLTNRIDTIGSAELADMKKNVAACADIMSFDIRNYDYDTFFKYVLYTHENFRILTDIEPMSASSAVAGERTVHLTGGEFIDYVMENVFMINPVKPPSGELVTRGFCYSDGYYFYTGGFEMFFATDITNINAVYGAGGNTFCIAFDDVYREGDAYTDEKSYAVLRRVNGRYVLLRLEMGGGEPSYDDIREYTPIVYFADGAWRRDFNTQ